MRFKSLIFALAFGGLSVFCAEASAFDPVDHGAGETRLVVAMGDSLTAGYNLPPDASFPAQLQKALTAGGKQVSVMNAGVSGDTSSGGRARLEWMLSGLSQSPDLVVLEFGGNDALRGIEPSITKDNLDAMLRVLIERDIPILLVGMRAPPNMGRAYEEEFNGIFPALAAEHNVPLYPFFLDGVALYPDLKLGDGIHPNREGVGVIVERIREAIDDLLYNN